MSTCRFGLHLVNLRQVLPGQIRTPCVGDADKVTAGNGTAAVLRRPAEQHRYSQITPNSTSLAAQAAISRPPAHPTTSKTLPGGISGFLDKNEAKGFALPAFLGCRHTPVPRKSAAVPAGPRARRRHQSPRTWCGSWSEALRESVEGVPLVRTRRPSAWTSVWHYIENGLLF